MPAYCEPINTAPVSRGVRIEFTLGVRWKNIGYKNIVFFVDIPKFSRLSIEVLNFRRTRTRSKSKISHRLPLVLRKIHYHRTSDDGARLFSVKAVRLRTRTNPSRVYTNK